MNKREVKRLFFDIEVSPNIGFFWTAGYKQTINYDSIIEERAVICICYKWQNEKTVHSLRWSAKQDDKAMIKKFVEVLKEADEAIGHNGDRFDLPWLRTRAILHGVDIPPHVLTIDTLKLSRQKFKFNSNRLDYIAKFLGFGGKSTTSYGMWKDIVLKKCEKSMSKMIRYCKRDVLILEKVFLKLQPYVPHKFHYGVKAGHSKISCPECGSYEVKHSKLRVTAAGSRRLQLQCSDCHKYHTVPESHFKPK